MVSLPPESATVLARTEGASAWGATEHLLACAIDALNAANWQRGGGKSRRPHPVSRPGVPDGDVEQLGGGTTYTAEEMREFLDANRDT